MSGRHGQGDDETTQAAYYGNRGQQNAPQGGYPPPGPGQYGYGGPQQAPPQYQFPGGYQPPQPPRAPKKRKKWPWIVGGIVLLLIIIIASSGGDDQPTTPTAGGASQRPASGAAPAAPSASAAPSSDDSASGTVVYEVTGTGKASNITYSSNGSGAQSQKTNVKLPFRQQIKADDFFGLYSLVAQNGQGGGKLTCKITKDGKVIGEGESDGEYAVVTCNGS